MTPIFKEVIMIGIIPDRDPGSSSFKQMLLFPKFPRDTLALHGKMRNEWYERSLDRAHSYFVQ